MNALARPPVASPSRPTMAVWTMGELLAGLAAVGALTGTFRQSLLAGLVAVGFSAMYVGVRFLPLRLQCGLVGLTLPAALLQGLGPESRLGLPDGDLTAAAALVAYREIVRGLLLFPLSCICLLLNRHPAPWQVVEIVRGDLLLSGIPLWFGCGVIAAAVWRSRPEPPAVSLDTPAPPADPWVET